MAAFENVPNGVNPSEELWKAFQELKLNSNAQKSSNSNTAKMVTISSNAAAAFKP